MKDIEQGKLYPGVVVKLSSGKWSDSKKKGRYSVQLDELISNQHTITAFNSVGSWRYNNYSGSSYGSYYPLFPGTRVLVTFLSESSSSGVIVSTLPNGMDNENYYNELPFKTETRDTVYQVIETRYIKSGLWFFENSDKYNNSVHLYYKRGRTGMIFSDIGISYFTDSDENKEIAGSSFEYVHGSKLVNTDGDYHHYSETNYNVYSGLNVNIKSKNTTTIHADKNLILTAPKGSGTLYTKKNFSLTSDKDIIVKGKNVYIGGDSTIKLKVGTSEIEITSSAINITTTNGKFHASMELVLESMMTALMHGAVQTKVGNSTCQSEIGGAVVNLAAPATTAGFVSTSGVSVGGGTSPSSTSPPTAVVVNPSEILLLILTEFSNFLEFSNLNLLPFFGEDALTMLNNINFPATSLSTLKAKVAAKASPVKPGKLNLES